MLDQPTPISAYDGHLVWSEQSTPGGRYFLMENSLGVTRRLPVAARSVPFDVDLGPSPLGGVAAVYSRCRRDVWSAGDPNTGLIAYAVPSVPRQECEIHRLDLATGLERRLTSLSRRGSSQTLPTIWGRGLAFVRVEQSRRGRAGVLPHLMYTDGSRPPREIPGGTAGLGGQGPLVLDLRESTLAFSWISDVRRCNGTAGDKGADPIPTEIWRVHIGVARQRVARVCNLNSGTGPAAVSTASLSRAGLSYVVFNPTNQAAPWSIAVHAPSGSTTTPVEGWPKAISTDDTATYMLVEGIRPGTYGKLALTRTTNAPEPPVRAAMASFAALRGQ